MVPDAAAPHIAGLAIAAVAGFACAAVAYRRASR
jgi:hypothetical protein